MPAAMPKTFGIGLANGPGAGVTWLQGAGVPFDFRYQYLAGGANTVPAPVPAAGAPHS